MCCDRGERGAIAWPANGALSCCSDDLRPSWWVQPPPVSHRGRGAAMADLSRKATFQSFEGVAPSIQGTTEPGTSRGALTH